MSTDKQSKFRQQASLMASLLTFVCKVFRRSWLNFKFTCVLCLQLPHVGIVHNRVAGLCQSPLLPTPQRNNPQGLLVLELGARPTHCVETDCRKDSGLKPFYLEQIVSLSL